MLELGNKLEDLQNAILDELQCNVCQQIMHPPIILCLTGHSFCSKCDAQMLSCPYCRGTKLASRNYALENIHNRIRLPCKNYTEGCTFVSKGESIAKHERNCAFNEQDTEAINALFPEVLEGTTRSIDSDVESESGEYQEMAWVLNQQFSEAFDVNEELVEEDYVNAHDNEQEQQQRQLAEILLQEEEEEVVIEEQVNEDNDQWLGAEYWVQMDTVEEEIVEEERELTADEYEIATGSDTFCVEEDGQLTETRRERQSGVIGEANEDDVNMFEMHHFPTVCVSLDSPYEEYNYREGANVSVSPFDIE